MRAIGLFFLGSLFFLFSNHLAAQSESQIEMTPAEYQNLMETILQAKKRRMIRSRYYYQMQQQRAVVSPPAPPALMSDNTNSEKIKELEKVYAQISEQQKTNPSNQAELEQIKKDLNNQIQELQSDLVNQQNENRNLTSQYQQRSERGEEELLRRNQYLETQVNELKSKYHNQQTAYQKQQRELEKLNKRFDKFQKSEQGKELVNQSDLDKEIEAMQLKIKEIETLQSTLILLGQNQSTSNDTTVNTIDPTYILAFSKQVADLEMKLEKSDQDSAQKGQIVALKKQVANLEQKLNNMPTPSKMPLPDYSRQIGELQYKLRELQAYHNHTIEAKPSAPKEDIRTFVTSRRQQNVFFQNGNSTLTSAEQNKIKEVASWLTTYDRLDITIKGYASNTGSLATNQRLSQQRAETVKQALLNLGVRADRIILEPLGIDTTSTDPANARRAEIHLLIRK